MVNENEGLIRINDPRYESRVICSNIRRQHVLSTN